MRASGQKLVKLCTHTTAAKLVVRLVIIISLGEMLLSYIANATTRTRACIHRRAHTHHRRHYGSMGRWRPSVMKLTPTFACSAGIHGQ